MILKRQFIRVFIIGLYIFMTAACTEKDVESQVESILADLEIDRSTSVDTIVSAIGTHYEIPGLAALVSSQESVLATGVYGTIDTRTNEPLTKDKIFDINSISKSVTTLIIMQLVEEGSLNLEDEITTIFPEFEEKIHEDYKSVKVIDFIKHGSGLRSDEYYVNSEDRPILRGSLPDKRYQYTVWVLQQEPIEGIGSYSFSNSNYIILGAIIEKITEKVYENNVLERIYFPLSLYSSGFGWPVDYKLEYTYGHMRIEGEVTPIRYQNNYYTRVSNPSDGIHLSPRDLMTYTREHMLGLNGRSLLLSKEGFQQMHKIEDASGLGWYASVFNSYTGTELGGIGDGYLTEIFISDSEDIGIVVLANVNEENTWLACKAVELALLKKYVKTASQ